MARCIHRILIDVPLRAQGMRHALRMPAMDVKRIGDIGDLRLPWVSPRVVKRACTLAVRLRHRAPWGEGCFVSDVNAATAPIPGLDRSGGDADRARKGLRSLRQPLT